jgi:DeoR/GlpR family transcriptional regulator of sugar metabolism
MNVDKKVNQNAGQSKVGKIAPTLIVPITSVKRLITDEGIDAEERMRLQTAGVEVVIAAP